MPWSKVPFGLLAGAVTVVVALASIPLIVASTSLPSPPDAFPILESIPERVSGAYLAVSTPVGEGFVGLFAWSSPPTEVPRETPVFTADAVLSVTLAQKGLDQPDRYRLFRLDDGAPVEVEASPTVPGRQMTLRAVEALASGDYLLDVPVGGMFAGRQYFVFSVGDAPSALVAAASAPQDLEGSPVRAAVSWALVALATLIAGFFTADLWRSFRRSGKPHSLAYAAGMAMFTLATASLVAALTVGWNGALFRSFYLFGAILNVPVLAIGSVYLVLGPRAGRTATSIVALFGAAAALITVSAPFSGRLPHSGVPAGSEMFTFPGPRLWAALGGSLGATVIVALGIASAVRFRRKNASLVRANGLIVLGVFAAAWGGTGLALGKESGFALSLVAAASLIWLGHRAAGRARHGRSRSAESSRATQTAT